MLVRQLSKTTFLKELDVAGIHRYFCTKSGFKLGYRVKSVLFNSFLFINLGNAIDKRVAS